MVDHHVIAQTDAIVLKSDLQGQDLDPVQPTLVISLLVVDAGFLVEHQKQRHVLP
jgi:hypothetical protein